MNESQGSRAGRLRLASRSLHALVCAVLLAASSHAASGDMKVDGTYWSFWHPTIEPYGYLFAGFVTRQPASAIADFSAFTVGAQIGAGNVAGVNQLVWGIAAEAWAYPGSRSPLFGVEASPINMEPQNEWPKVAFYATFKNRPDTEYERPPDAPMNAASQALRIESQPGTGFERGVVFGRTSLHASSAAARPVAIDFAEMNAGDVEGIDVMRFPDGCSLVYLGRGKLGTRCDP